MIMFWVHVFLNSKLFQSICNLKLQYIFENKYVQLCLETLIHFNCEVFTKTLLKPVLPNKL